MTAMTNYLENELLDHVLGKGTRDFPSPTTLALVLCIGDPLDTATGASCNEHASQDGYTRKAITFGVASGGSASNSGAVTFDQATANWTTVSHFCIADSLTHGAGNILFKGQLTTSKSVQNGDTAEADIGAIVVSMD